MTEVFVATIYGRYNQTLVSRTEAGLAKMLRDWYSVWYPHQPQPDAGASVEQLTRDLPKRRSKDGPRDIICGVHQVDYDVLAVDGAERRELQAEADAL